MFITGGAATSAVTLSIRSSTGKSIIESASASSVMSVIGASGSTDDSILAMYGCLSGSMFYVKTTGSITTRAIPMASVANRRGAVFETCPFGGSMTDSGASLIITRGSLPLRPHTAPRRSTTVGSLNVANSIDGSDGSVGGILTTVTSVTVVTVPPYGDANSLTPRIVRVGVRPGPSRPNRHLVSTPTGDIGLSVSGVVPVRMLTTINIEAALSTTGGSPTAEISLATT